MKKTILLSSVLAVGAAIAASVTTDNALGVLAINPKDKGAQKLVAVPFDGYVSGPVKVCDLVSPTGLKKGSKLYAVTTDGYDVWELDNDNGSWVAGKTITVGANGNPVEGTSKAAGEATVSRGDAFWLEPVTELETTTYLMGQKAENPMTGSSTVVPNKWNLISNPLTVKATMSGTFAEGDRVTVQQSSGKQFTYTYKNDAWTYRRNPDLSITSLANGLQLEPGEGCWFRGASATEVTWTRTPSDN